MQIRLFGCSSSCTSNSLDTSLFVRKPFSRIKYFESKIEEDIDMRNQYTMIKIPILVDDREAASKVFVDIKHNNASIVKNTGHANFDDKNPTTDNELSKKLLLTT